MKKKRKMQAWQTYHTLTYEKKWKSVIDAEWAEHCVNWETSHPGEKMKDTRFAFMNRFIIEKFNGETDDVKKEVEEYRTKAVEESADNINSVYQQ